VVFRLLRRKKGKGKIPRHSQTKKGGKGEKNVSKKKGGKKEEIHTGLLGGGKKKASLRVAVMKRRKE